MQKTNPEVYLIEKKDKNERTSLMFKDTSRTHSLLIARISQCQQNKICLFNDSYRLILCLNVSYFEKDLSIHTNNVTTIAYRLIKNIYIYDVLI